MTAKIVEAVSEAHETQNSLRVTAGSSWLNAGRPVIAAKTLSVAQLSGVVDYVPSDLTITVRSGTTLAEINKATRENNQWLPVNPFGSDNGTIGATVATGSSGPLAQGFGGIRDLVLGFEAVTGDAKIIRGGGRVVKNVAGFDLVRLMTGSWGTLGVITELTLRLYGSPSNRRTIAMEAPVDARHLGAKLHDLRDAPVIPFALELLNAGSARKVGLPARPIILIELGGNGAAVEAQTDALRKLGALVDASPEMWDALRKSDDDESVVFRLSGLPALLPERCQRAERIGASTEKFTMHASIGRGTVRCNLSGPASEAVLEQLATPVANDSVILEQAPAAWWTRISPSAVGDRVSQNLKRAFDPFAIL
ncbi:MAG TPA: FAD-binding protein, partial [Gemmatimonadaceae bacterium]|nr:FAD-binding protein [Gemmatimonadaceae bacterium]